MGPTSVISLNPLECRGVIKIVPRRVIRSVYTGRAAVDGWAVTFGTARRGLDGVARHVSPRCTKCNSPPIGQCDLPIIVV